MIAHFLMAALSPCYLSYVTPDQPTVSHSTVRWDYEDCAKCEAIKEKWTVKHPEWHWECAELGKEIGI